MKTSVRVVSLSSLLVLSGLAQADVLFDNGPIITNPTGGTGAIAGLPISVSDSFASPTTGTPTSILGFSASVAINSAAAENFVVPAGGWDLSSVTLFAFRTSQLAPSVSAIHVNLWTSAPYSADSPGPLPDPIPTPVLASALVLPAGDGTFVCHRQGHTTTNTNRPVFSYTVSLDGLPNGGVLPPGEYWLEWSFVPMAGGSTNVFIPAVSPRDLVPVHNARQRNVLVSGGNQVWFEGREGYLEGVAEGRAYTLPFILNGTVPQGGCPADLDNGSGNGTPDGGVDINDLLYFLSAFEGGTPAADLDNDGDPAVGTPDGGVDVNDLLFFLARFEAGC